MSKIHQRHISNSIRKRIRKLLVEVEASEKKGKQIDAFYDFAGDMLTLAERIEAEETLPDSDTLLLGHSD